MNNYLKEYPEYEGKSKEYMIANMLDRINYGTAMATLHALDLHGPEAKIKYIAQKLEVSEDKVREVAISHGYDYSKKN